MLNFHTSFKVVFLPLALLCASSFAGATSQGRAAQSSEIEPLFVHSPGERLLFVDGRTEIVRAGAIQLRTDLLADGAENQRGRFSLELFDQETHIVAFERGYLSGTGTWIWIGKVEGVEHGRLIVAVHENAASASLSLGERRYAIEAQRPDAGVHRLLELDPSEMKACGVDARHGIHLPSSTNEGLSSAVGNLVVDVLIYYLPQVAGAHGGTNGAIALANTAVAKANSAYSASQIPLTMVLVGAFQTAQTGNADLSTLLTRLRETNDNWYDEVHAKRNELFADYVALLTGDTDPLYAGLAYVMTNVSPSFEASAFSTSFASYITGSEVFAHELGHNMGCAHDRDNAAVAGAYPYSYGFRTPLPGQYRTIMSYAPGTRIPYFSNPGISYAGSAIGIAHPSATSADNSRGIEEAAPVFTLFRLADCNENGVLDDLDIENGDSLDCDSNGVPDECQVAGNGDCNGNGIPDACDIDNGLELDCNFNGVPDYCDLESGSSEDCNLNSLPDECETSNGGAPDCNGNSVPDECEIADDCNGDGVPNDCDFDCNLNGQSDLCDVANGSSIDCDADGVPDECVNYQGDCNLNGIPDNCDIGTGLSVDCNLNGVPDDCDLATNASPDCNSNDTPDECEVASGAETDCNENGLIDWCELLLGVTSDCNFNGIPDPCDLESEYDTDCDLNGVPDECQPEDCNANGVADVCDVVVGVSFDCNANFIPDECDVLVFDCNANLIPDECDVLFGGALDCNANLTPDDCDIGSEEEADCNSNLRPDSCDIADGISPDANGNGVLDSCDQFIGGDGGEGSRFSGTGSIEGCFVATAAYGDYDSREVFILRRLRDETLVNSAAGLAFIDFYYKHSPPLAEAIAARPWARTASRLALAPLVALSFIHLEAPWALPLGLLLLLGFVNQRQKERDIDSLGAL